MTPYRPCPDEPLTEPKLLAAVPPMDWISATWTGDTPWLTIAARYEYFAPSVLWVEPLAGLTVLSFRIQGQSWNSQGPIPAELFKLAMVDISEMPIISSLAMGCVADIELTGPICTVLLGGKHLTNEEYFRRDTRHPHYVPLRGPR